MNIQTVSRTQPKLKELYEEKYEVASGNYEFANLFIELAHKLSSDEAENTFIFPHKFLNNNNGKLSAVKWMSKDGNSSKSYERAYKYSYDGADRYTAASYAERPNTAASNTAFTATHGWDEGVSGYDENGNIQGITRNTGSQGSGSYTQIDNLNYSYNSGNANQLQTVSDATGNSQGFRNYTGSTGSYTYDSNGNMTADPYKGISSITYNVQNRSQRLSFTAARYIDYTYDAGGTLLRKQVYDSNTLQSTTDYIDGFNYVNGTLSYFPMPEGRVRNTGSALKSEYILTDQQGNARASLEDNGSGVAVVRQENSYYGFGLVMPGSPVATPTTDNKKLYNGGAEWQNDYSNLPDLQQTYYRNYDAAIGRFVGVDPIPTSAENMSVYQYGGNNPVMMNDPMGDLLKADTPNPNADYGPGPDSFARDRAYVYGPGGVEGGFSQYGRATLHNAIGDLSQWESAYQRMAMSHATSSVGNTITVNYYSDVGSGHIDVSSNDIMQFINSSLGMYYLPTIYVSNGRLNTPSWWGDSQRFIGNPGDANQGGRKYRSTWLWRKFNTDLGKW